MATKSIMFNGEEFTYETDNDIKIDFDGITRGQALRFCKYLRSIGINDLDIKFAPHTGVDRFHYRILVF